MSPETLSKTTPSTSPICSQFWSRTRNSSSWVSLQGWSSAPVGGRAGVPSAGVSVTPAAGVTVSSAAGVAVSTCAGVPVTTEGGSVATCVPGVTSTGSSVKSTPGVPVTATSSPPQADSSSPRTTNSVRNRLNLFICNTPFQQTSKTNKQPDLAARRKDDFFKALGGCATLKQALLFSLGCKP